MDNLNIILFLCNWGPHTAYQTLQDNLENIPKEIKMIRIPCTGRISKSLLLKAFEKGADGVALMGCKAGSCRYGSGTDTAKKNTKDTREILGLLGLGKERMKLATFMPDEPGALLEFLEDFVQKIRNLGRSPVKQAIDTDLNVTDEITIADIVSRHDIFACQDCGKCTSACPLALTGQSFSPRAVASAVISGEVDSPMVKTDVWSCLTCGLCYDRCPSAVNFPEFIQDMRSFYRQHDTDTHEAHGGFFQSLMRTMTVNEFKADRWGWLPCDIQIDRKSKILFFGGCAPFFDIFFREFLGAKTSNILADSMRLLNFFDIRPALLEDERCCGHDLLWTGDKENFLKLAKLNVDSIKSRGIEEVITACPECYRSLAHDYPKHGVEVDFKITHIYEFLEKEIGKGAVGFKKLDKKLTFQDSCRLTRLDEVSEFPRKLIKRLKIGSFTEMQNSGKSSICCGNSAWTGCGANSKALQVKRLKQAHDTGSNLMVTSCPKCQLHLRCSMEDPFLGDDLKIEMMDLTSVIAKTIYWE